MGFYDNKNIWFLKQTEKKSTHCDNEQRVTEFIMYNITNNKEAHQHQMFCQSPHDNEYVKDVIVDKEEPSKIFVLTAFTDKHGH